MLRFTLLLAFAFACSGSTSSPKAPAEEEKAPRVERFQIGTLEAYALEDGVIAVPNDGTLFVGRPPSETAEVLAAAGLPRDTIRLDIQCLLVKAGDRVLLFDTGTGDATSAMVMGGRLLQSFAQASIAPTAVTDIFISHAHGDHVGGLVTKTGLAFPAATIHISAPEWSAFQAETDDEAKRLVAAIASKVSAFEPGAQVLPVVKAVATQGHTPGHSSYEIGAGTDKLFFIGDLAHHSVISVQRPAWSIPFDGDRPAAEAMRQQTLAKLAADHTRVFAVHFPFPGVGHVVARGPGLAWKAE